MTLRELKIGKNAIIKSVGGEGALRQHFLDMGVIPGAQVMIVKYAPMGDPVELLIHGYELTLRLADAEKIEVEPFGETEILVDGKPAIEHTKKKAEAGESNLSDKAGKKNKKNNRN